ncbi:MAG: Gfo/Idh/MocA family oxidoreductase [Lentisphaeria bacterium]|jgi:predicted dehydrogenase|nr:Gfo/Idh/MocA family oxidoreductase [Lentisphaeria bacterium]
MSEPVRIVLVAVGGYGNTHVNALLDHGAAHGCQIVGIVDPFAEGCRRLAELKSLGIPIYPDLDAFYASHTADLAVISSPIHLHTPQTCTALAHGSSVLCEKPLGATYQEAARVIAARDRAGRFVATGYQWSFNEAILALKGDILAGRFGAAKRLRTLVLWPRNKEYYGRNTWAGMQLDRMGNWILDSPVNNATAHYLHNMLYVLGSQVDRAIRPRTVAAELYRANAITNYDTAAVRITVAGGAEVLYYTSHAIEHQRGPEFIYEFEKGTVRYGGADKTIVAAFADGTSRDYGDPQANIPKKLWDAVAAVRGEGTISCGPEAASMHTLVMNGIQDSVPEIIEFSPVVQAGEGLKSVAVAVGLEEALIQGYDSGRLPHELGLPWARVGQTLCLDDYTAFPAKR